MGRPRKIDWLRVAIYSICGMVFGALLSPRWLLSRFDWHATETDFLWHVIITVLVFGIFGGIAGARDPG